MRIFNCITFSVALLFFYVNYENTISASASSFFDFTAETKKKFISKIAQDLSLSPTILEGYEIDDYRMIEAELPFDLNLLECLRTENTKTKTDCFTRLEQWNDFSNYHINSNPVPSKEVLNNGFDFYKSHEELWRRQVQFGRKAEAYCFSVVRFSESIELRIKKIEESLIALLPDIIENEDNNKIENFYELKINRKYNNNEKAIKSLSYYNKVRTSFLNFQEFALAIENNCSSGKSNVAFDNYVASEYYSRSVDFLSKAGVSDFFLKGGYGNIIIENLNINVFHVENVLLGSFRVINSNVNSFSMKGSVQVECTITKCPNNQIDSRADIRRLYIEGYIGRSSFYIDASAVFGSIEFVNSIFSVKNDMSLRKIIDQTPSLFNLFETINSNSSVSLFVHNRLRGPVKPIIADSLKPIIASALSAYAVEVENTLTLRNSVFGGRILLGKMKTSELRFANLYVDGDINMWGAELSGPSFFGHYADYSGERNGLTINGDFFAYFLKAQNLQFSDVYISKNIILKASAISDRLLFDRVVVKSEINMYGMKSNIVDISKTHAEQIIMEKSHIENAVGFVESVFTDVKLDDATMRNLIVYGSKPDLVHWDFDTSCDLNSRNTYYMNSSQFGLSEAMLKRFTELAGHDKFLPNCIERLSAVGSNIEQNLDLAGIFRSQIALQMSQVGNNVIIGSENTAFKGNSCISIRDMKAENFIVNIDPTQPMFISKESYNLTPAYIEMSGTRLNSVRFSDAAAKKVSRDFIVRRLSDLFFNNKIECEKDGTQQIPIKAENRFHYNPEPFDAIYNGLINSGNLDLARVVKIEKNRSYAASLSESPEWHRNIHYRIFYQLADHISGFGQKNLNGVILIVAIVMIGSILGLIGEPRLQLALSYIAYTLKNLVDPYSRKIYTTTTDIKKNISASDANMNILMFSIDRAVPSLGLDSRFSTHNDRKLGPILSTYFYLQRMICFIIIAFMIAGTFDVFQ